MATELARIQVRRDTAAAWTAANPVLADGEPGFEHDTAKLKIGDGSTAWSALAYQGGTGSASTAAVSVMDAPYNAVGDGVTDDTTAVQAAVNAASAAYALLGGIVNVVFPSGHKFRFGQITLPGTGGIRFWAYGATLKPNTSTWTNHGWFYYPANSSPALLPSIEFCGGTILGTGNETDVNNMFVYQMGANTGVQDLVVRDMRISGWGTGGHFYPRVAGDVLIANNNIDGTAGLNNAGFQNMITIDPGSLTPPFTGRIIVTGNLLHNAVADAIAVVVVGNVIGGAAYYAVSDNIVTADPPVAQAAAFTAGSRVVTITDGSDTSAAVGKYVTGPHLGKAMYIASYNAGAHTYTLASNIGSVIGGSGTFAGNLYVGVYRSGVGMEIDALAYQGLTDVAMTDNIIVGYERAPLFYACSGASAGHWSTKSRIAGNIVTNGQIDGDLTWASNNPQGSCIGLSGGGTHTIDIENNALSQASPVAPINSPITNIGKQAGNRFTAQAMQGRKALVAGTFTVPTAEIRTGDNVILNVVSPAGTRGSIQLGQVTSGTLQVGPLIYGTLQVTSTSGSTAVTLAAGSIPVPANGTVLGITGANITSGTTLTINSSTTGTLSANATATSTFTGTVGLISPVPLAAGSLAVPSNGTILGISGPGIPPPATLTILSSSTGALSDFGAYAATVAAHATAVGSFTVNSIQPGTASTIQTGDTSTVYWKIDH